MNENRRIFIMKLLEKLFNELNKANVKYLVVGGVAVNLYGLRRATYDLDILLFLDNENLKNMDVVMKKLGYIERNPISVLTLGNPRQVKKWVKEKNFKAYSFLPPENLPVQIDVIIEESLQFSKFDKNKIEKKEDKLMVPVVSIDDLIKMKKKAGRDKDLMDLDALMALKNL